MSVKLAIYKCGSLFVVRMTKMINVDSNLCSDSFNAYCTCLCLQGNEAEKGDKEKECKDEEGETVGKIATFL